MGLLDMLAGLAGGRMLSRDSRAEQGTVNETVQSRPGEKRMLSVTRMRQAVNMAAGYDLLVNGEVVTKIGNGGSCMTEIPQEAEIAIRCSSLHFKKITLKVRAGEHPRIEFSTVYGGGIRAQTFDMEILSMNGK